jgi:hypothetical protein
MDDFEADKDPEVIAYREGVKAYLKATPGAVFTGQMIRAGLNAVEAWNAEVA